MVYLIVEIQMDGSKLAPSVNCWNPVNSLFIIIIFSLGIFKYS